MKILNHESYLGAVKDRSNLSTSKRKTHVSGVSGGNGVHGKTTSFVGSSGKSGHLVSLGGGAHLKAGGLRGEN